MAGAVLGAIAVGVAAAGTIYSAEQQRLAQSKADDQLRDQKNEMLTQQNWQKKKKGINDQNAALAALRLRGTEGTPGTAGTAPTPMAGTPQSTGILGGIGGGLTVPTNVSKAVNSPLGL
jgi:hypothetical protein